MHTAALDHLTLAAFVVVGALFVPVTVFVSNLLAPSKPDARKGATYECGVEPVGPPWVQFRIGYYVYALLFVVFDIETVFLYPWAVAFNALGAFVLVEMAVFIAILAFGLWYAWKEGALAWR
ncbi:MAG: NADH-quinone oxidoreductase subunit A [Coriobacteriia bacterium]|nr:NADH-quinone oxidoreductase subunit A [Coriobacteriia bacterium]